MEQGHRVSKRRGGTVQEKVEVRKIERRDLRCQERIEIGE